MLKTKRTARFPVPQPAVGWREWVKLPELAIAAIKVKVDTGARSSALHASDINIFQRGRKKYVGFSVHPFQRDCHHTVKAEAPLLEERWIKSSNGKRQLRPVIQSTLRLGEQEWPIELTLTARDMMGFRMLLGREAIRGRYLVDSGRSFLIGKQPRRRTKVRKVKARTTQRRSKARS